MPKLRQQNDDLGDEISLSTTLKVSKTPSKTRQEFKDDCDINQVLLRYGALPQGQKATYGVQNFDSDLTDAYALIQRAHHAFEELPPAAKKLYPTWEALAHQIALGDANPALGEALNEAVAAAAKAAKLKEAAAVGVPPTDDDSLTTEGRQALHKSLLL